VSTETHWRYGVCTWMFADTPLETVATRLSEIGYDGVELLGDLEKHAPHPVRRTLEPRGLAILSLTPEDVDLAHPDRATREQAVDYYLRLLTFAKETDAPLASCHGAVGRIRALSTQKEEEALLLEGVKRIADKAEALSIDVAMEVLNRYESHLLNTASDARRFVDEVGSKRVGILLDTYHMNIEEPDPVAALSTAGDKLFLFHAADSNRRAVGRGHVPFPSLVHSLVKMGYAGSVVVETPASGPDPFTPVKGPDFAEKVFEETAHSLAQLRQLEAHARDTASAAP
jgi:sugar phosphate isomerase/epimerase